MLECGVFREAQTLEWGRVLAGQVVVGPGEAVGRGERARAGGRAVARPWDARAAKAERGEVRPSATVVTVCTARGVEAYAGPERVVELVGGRLSVSAGSVWWLATLRPFAVLGAFAARQLGALNVVQRATPERLSLFSTGVTTALVRAATETWRGGRVVLTPDTGLRNGGRVLAGAVPYGPATALVARRAAKELGLPLHNAQLNAHVLGTVMESTAANTVVRVYC